MSSLTQFMNSAAGRIARVLLGVVLIVVGLNSIGGGAGYVVAAIGLVPIALGLSGRCLIEFLPGGR
jgi:hypothetical protein